MVGQDDQVEWGHGISLPTGTVCPSACSGSSVHVGAGIYRPTDVLAGMRVDSPPRNHGQRPGHDRAMTAAFDRANRIDAALVDLVAFIDRDDIGRELPERSFPTPSMHRGLHARGAFRPSRGYLRWLLQRGVETLVANSDYLGWPQPETLLWPRTQFLVIRDGRSHQAINTVGDSLQG